MHSCVLDSSRAIGIAFDITLSMETAILTEALCISSDTLWLSSTNRKVITPRPVDGNISPVWKENTSVHSEVAGYLALKYSKRTTRGSQHDSEKDTTAQVGCGRCVKAKEDFDTGD